VKFSPEIATCLYSAHDRHWFVHVSRNE
jgi:hypothetical protein